MKVYQRLQAALLDDEVEEREGEQVVCDRVDDSHENEGNIIVLRNLSLVTHDVI